MATRKIFTDGASRLDIYVNDDNKLFMEIAYIEDGNCSGFITLPIEDVKELRNEIDNYINQLQLNG